VVAFLVAMALEELSDRWIEWLTTPDPRTPEAPPVLDELPS
jgi:hypothetical protein